MESKYYHTQTQQEWDWLFKHFNLVNEQPHIWKWFEDTENADKMVAEAILYGYEEEE